MIKSRFAILDGFRALAILAVVFYHFFSHGTSPQSGIELYPYRNNFDYFKYGYLGVHFFFIISGFVIFFTLDNTNHFGSFWKKRLIRLVPSIAVASLITFVVARIFDTSMLFRNSHEALNFIPSLTFIKPEILNTFLAGTGISFDYISSSYWSLWPEIQFYLFASITYYLNKDKFAVNFLSSSILAVIVNYVFQHVQGSNKLQVDLPASVMDFYIKWIQNGFNLPNYLPFFCFGVLFYSLFKNRLLNSGTSLFVRLCLLFFILFSIYCGGLLPIRLIYLSMLLLFFGFIYISDKLILFGNKIMTNIGESSYFLYLIHENIGLLLIYSLAGYFLPFGLAFTLLLIVTQIVLCHFYIIYLDKKITTWLKKKMLK